MTVKIGNLKRVLIALLIFLILIITLSFLYFQNKFASSVPLRSGTINLAKLDAAVKITFDKMGIPQVWAKSAHDAWFALGWLHAGDRLFHSDVIRRIATGRLAELLGRRVLEIDIQQRRMGHHKRAREAVKNLDDKTRGYLEAYSAGINSWVAEAKSLPFEYTLLSSDFLPWTVEDCAAIFSFQTWFIDALQNNDTFYHELARLVGPDKAGQLSGEYPLWAPETVPGNIRQYFSLFDPRQQLADHILTHGLQAYAMTGASNSWLIAPHKSISKKAILASDPHLQLAQLPQFWYMVGLHCVETNLNVLGVTTPGIPIVAFGHNGRAAWSFTAAAVDVSDQYTELINPENKGQYLTPAGWVSFKRTVELIRISGQDHPDTLEILHSRHGPVVEINDSLNQAYALHWAGFDLALGAAIATAFELMDVQDFATFRKIVTGLGALNANWLYADVQGNIGYQLGAPVPIRKSMQGSFRLRGWIDDDEWQGYQPLAKTPYAYNPDRGWLASCNNKPVHDFAEHNLPGNYAADRILRIKKLLREKNKFDVSDMKLFQLDFTSEFLLKWKAPILESLKQLEQDTWFHRVLAWQGELDSESQVAALVETWLYYFKEYTFRDELGDLTDQLHRRVIVRDRVFYRLYNSDHQRWFDDMNTSEIIETKEDMAIAAMNKALEEITVQTLGDIQYLSPRHPLGEIPVLAGLIGLKKGPFSRGGNSGTLNATTARRTDDEFQVVAGPSWRFIIDFSDIDGAVFVLPGGQSGNPMDEHFFDFYPLWAAGVYWNVPFTRSRVENKAVSTLQLLPGPL